MYAMPSQNVYSKHWSRKMHSLSKLHAWHIFDMHPALCPLPCLDLLVDIWRKRMLCMPRLSARQFLHLCEWVLARAMRAV